VVEANVARAERSFVRENTGTGSYRDVYPGVHFVYEPLDGLLLRTSYNRSVSRPNVAQLRPAVTENPDTMTITAGNPELKPYHSNNFEFTVEKYFEPVGLLSAGVFLKEISDYTRTTSSTLGPEGIDGQGTYANYTMSTTTNVGSARVRGVEFSYQQQFSFLPGVFRGLGAFANYTYLQAEGNFGGTVTTQRLANLAPRSGNAGINYRFRGFDARVLLNWTGEKYKGTNGGIDYYNDERRLIDVKLQYTFTRRYDEFMDIANITDEPTRTDLALNGLRHYNTKQGVSFTAGVRGRF
jgi:TonB-dependent receptor